MTRTKFVGRHVKFEIKFSQDNEKNKTKTLQNT